MGKQGKQWKQCQTLFLGTPKSLQVVTAAMNLKDAYSLEGKLWPTKIVYWTAEILLSTKGLSGQGYGSSSVHVWMWELDCEESWVLKNWYYWTVMLEKILESPLDCKEIQPVHPKRNLSWVFIGRTDVEAETPVLWPPDAELTHWKRLWCWEGLGAGGEGDDRGWDGWMASPTQWTWVCVSSKSWWGWTGKPVMLQSMGRRVRHDWATELKWLDWPKGSFEFCHKIL